MSLRRHNAKRDQSEPAVVETLKQLGCQVYRLDKPCDLLLCFRGRLALAEVKTGKEKLNPWQTQFAQTWPVFVLRTPSDAITLITELAREAA